MPIIIHTGYSHAVSEKKVKELGVRGFIMKPVTMKELSEAVSRVFE